MKAKNMRKWLEQKVAWWNKLPESAKRSTTKPGSVKTR